MELVLNFGWVLLATLLLSVWLRSASPAAASRRMQLISLAMLILILFPVVSVTDDLQAAQYPAIVDGSQRRDHVRSTPHSIFPAVTALPAPVFGGMRLGFLRIAAPARLPSPLLDHPALTPIQSRPPPAV
jgi:hypothetical protein